MNRLCSQVTKPLKEKPRTIDKTIQPQNDETKTSKVSQPTKPSWSSMFSFKFKPLPKKISISETPSKKEKPKPKTENRKTIPKRASFTSSIKVPEIFSTKQKKTENPKKETNTSTKSDLPKSEVEETDENKQTKDKEKKASTKFFSSFRKVFGPAMQAADKIHKNLMNYRFKIAFSNLPNPITNTKYTRYI